MVVFVTQSKWHSRVKEQKEDGWLKQARPGRILSLHIFNKFYALSMCCCREKDEKSLGELLDRIFTELSPLLGKRPASALRTMMVISVLNTLPEPKIIIVFLYSKIV